MNTLHRRFVRLTAAGLIAAAMAVSACAEGIVPVHAEVSAIQDSSKAIYFDGSFELELAPEVKEVLERGVTLIIKIAGIGLTVRSVRSLKEFVSVITR